jgi:ABC-type amino acid transport system permease subunit
MEGGFVFLLGLVQLTPPFSSFLSRCYIAFLKGPPEFLFLFLFFFLGLSFHAYGAGLLFGPTHSNSSLKQLKDKVLSLNPHA